MLRLLQMLVAAALAFFAYQYVAQHNHPTATGQTLAAEDVSNSKPPEAWQYGTPSQRQFYSDYWEKHPHGPAQKVDLPSEADSHMPSIATGENPNGLPPAAPPPMPGPLSRRPDVVGLTHDRYDAYRDLQIAIRLRDDVVAQRLYTRIVAIDAKLNELILQSR